MELKVHFNNESNKIIIIRLSEPFSIYREKDIMEEIEVFAKERKVNINSSHIRDLISNMANSLSGCGTGCTEDAKILAVSGYKYFKIEYAEGKKITAHAEASKKSGGSITIEVYPRGGGT